MLGVKIDENLNFNNHILDLFKNAGRKVSAITRVTPFMGLSKRKLLMNAFFTSQFSYYPLIWMSHSRSNNRKINMLHERCLRIIYNKNNRPSLNYGRKTILSQFTLEIFKVLQLKCLGSIMGYHHD